MLVSFDDLPDHSRIWIYQSSRPFTEDEIESVRPQLASFLEKWVAHGQDLHAGFEIKYNRFIVIGINQNLHSASGCSIDASVHFIQQLEKEYTIDLLDKMNVTFKQGPYIAYKPLADFRKMVKNKSVSGDTIVFNNLVNTKEEYVSYWEVPMSESWHNRFLVKK